MGGARIWIARLCGTYAVALVLIIVMWFFIPHLADKEAGTLCYRTDALLPGIKCTGDWGRVLSFVLTLPIALLAMPGLGVVALARGSAGLPAAAYLLGLSALCWAPLIYLAWYVVAGRKGASGAT